VTNKKATQSHLINQQPANRVRAYLALAAISFLWGTTWIASRQAVRDLPPLQLSAIRQLLAGIVFLIYFLIRRTSWPRGKEWFTITVLSFLNLFLTNGLTTIGVKYIPAGLASIIAAIFPLWLVIFGLFRNKMKIPIKAIIGLLLGFAGICVIFYQHLGDLLLVDFRFGILISLTASLTWALGTIYTKKEVESFNPYFSICLQMILSGILLLFVAILSGNWIPLSQVPTRPWLDIVYLAFFGSILTFVCYLYALQRLPAEQVSIYAYLNPVVAVILGWIFFQEKFTLFIGLGGLITLYGVFLVNKSFRIKGR
jgi:drug/metabolite transporter (DMT)-like permease